MMYIFFYIHRFQKALNFRYLSSFVVNTCILLGFLKLNIFLYAIFFCYYFLAFNLVFSLQVLDISAVPEIDASMCSFFFFIID